jgi:hypothetical protein
VEAEAREGAGAGGSASFWNVSTSVEIARNCVLSAVNVVLCWRPNSII